MQQRARAAATEVDKARWRRCHREHGAQRALARRRPRLGENPTEFLSANDGDAPAISLAAYARGKKLWIRFRDVSGKWRDASTGYEVG